MNNIVVRYEQLPTTIRAFTVRNFDDDVYYTITINSCISTDMQHQAYLHEIDHIECEDFSCGLSVDYIESVRHR